MAIVRPSILLKFVYGDIKLKKFDCVGHAQNRMGKHLLNLKARTKGRLADGRPIGSIGRLSGAKN